MTPTRARARRRPAAPCRTGPGEGGGCPSRSPIFHAPAKGGAAPGLGPTRSGVEWEKWEDFNRTQR